MNYIKQLNAFFEKAAADERLNPSHISLYVALFQYWNMAHFTNPISITRGELMKVSKIGSKTTYNKTMNELSHYGYIRYLPSHNPVRGSLVHLFSFETSADQPLAHNHTKNGTTAGHVLVPSINNTNNKKGKQLLKGTKILYDNNSKNYSEPL